LAGAALTQANIAALDRFLPTSRERLDRKAATPKGIHVRVARDAIPVVTSTLPTAALPRDSPISLVVVPEGNRASLLTSAQRRGAFHNAFRPAMSTVFAHSLLCTVGVSRSHYGGGWRG